MGIGAIIERQVSLWNTEKAAASERGAKARQLSAVITVSRELGSGGASVARSVAERLGCSLVGYSIVDTVSKNLGLPKDVLTYMDEKLKSQFLSWFDSSFCGEVDQSDYHRYMLATIRSLAELGGVVLLGRGGAFVETDRRKINVRVIAPKEVRIERIMERDRCDRKRAVDAIDKSDKTRTKFIRSVFDRDWRNPIHYDIVINSAHMDVAHAAALVACAWHNYSKDASRLVACGRDATS